MQGSAGDSFTVCICALKVFLFKKLPKPEDKQKNVLRKVQKITSVCTKHHHLPLRVVYIDSFHRKNWLLDCTSPRRSIATAGLRARVH